jgi:ribosomal protein L35
MPKLKTHSGTKDRVRITKNRKRALKGLKTRGGRMANNIKKNLGV